MKSHEKIIEQLKKLETLANSGDTPETELAKQRFLHILHKYKVNFEDLRNEEKQTYYFPYRTNAERKLIIQIIAHTCEKPEMWGFRNNIRKVATDLTMLEHLKIQELIDFHLPLFRKEWKKLRNVFTISYFHLYNIFPKGEPPDREREEVDMRELEKILHTMQSIDFKPFRKSLKAKGGPDD
ncbi:MAG: hypothetical protein DRQ49_19615, partial [Gammaproteobacteria bacterium]